MQETRNDPAQPIAGCAKKSIHEIRRENLRCLLQTFVQERIACGETAKGVEQSFASHIQVSPSMLSQIKGARNISDALSKQIEHACKQAPGWLSRPRVEMESTTPGVMPNMPPVTTEEEFVALAIRSWRLATAARRSMLVELLRESDG